MPRTVTEQGRGARRRVLTWLLVPASVALALAVCEGLVRLLGLGPSVARVGVESIVPSEHPGLRYVPRPGSPDADGAISSAGLRDREFPEAKPPGVVRIAVIGDSIAFGYGVRTAESFPKQLEQLFAADEARGGPRVEVLNFGVPGYNVTQNVARLRHEALRFDPDLVLYAYCLNDPQKFSLEGEVLDALGEARERLGLTATGDPKRWLTHSKLYLMLRQLLSALAPGSEDEEPLRLDPGVSAAKQGREVLYFQRLYGRNEARRRLDRELDALAAISRERKLPVVVAIFPIFRTGPGDYPLGDLHREVSSQVGERGLVAIDLAPRLASSGEGDAELAMDLFHPTPRGHRAAAEALHEALLEGGWVPGLAPRTAAGPR